LGNMRTDGITTPYPRFGDFNGDGISDLLIADTNYPVENGKDYLFFPFYRYSTVVYILPGSTTMANGDIQISSTSTYKIVGDTPFSSISTYFLCSDLDGDGRDEIVSFDSSGEHKDSDGARYTVGNLFILYPGDFDQSKFKIENMQDNTCTIGVILVLVPVLLTIVIVVIVILNRRRRKLLETSRDDQKMPPR
jgi:hypothetical protein